MVLAGRSRDPASRDTSNEGKNPPSLTSLFIQKLPTPGFLVTSDILRKHFAFYSELFLLGHWNSVPLILDLKTLSKGLEMEISIPGPWRPCRVGAILHSFRTQPSPPVHHSHRTPSVYVQYSKQELQTVFTKFPASFHNHFFTAQIFSIIIYISYLFSQIFKVRRANPSFSKAVMKGTDSQE